MIGDITIWIWIDFDKKLKLEVLGDLAALFKLGKENFFCSNRIILISFTIPKNESLNYLIVIYAFTSSYRQVQKTTQSATPNLILKSD